MMATVPGAVLACGHPPTSDAGIGTGYVHTAPGGDAPAICYQCADVLARVELAATPPGEAFSVYPSSDGRTMTTWSGGGELARVTAHWTSRRGAFGHELHYWQAVGPDGRRYHGRNAGPGMYLALRPSKVTVR